MPAFDLCIFDFDGTLADSFPWFVSVLDQTADHFHLKRVDPAEIESLRERSSRDALAHLGVPLWKLPQISIYMRNLATEGLARIPLFAGAADAMAALHAAGMTLALVSSNSESNVRTVLGDAAKRIDRFDCGSSLFGKAGHFRSVLDATKIPKARTIAIGDEIRDIEAARNTGVAIGSITFGYNSRRALEGHRPDFLFDSYEELVRALRP
jgi:phosphoglycolate phosphatase